MAASSGAEGWRAVGVRLSLKMAAQDWGGSVFHVVLVTLRMSCVPKGEGRATSHLLSMMDSQPFPRDGPRRNVDTHSMVILQLFCYASLHHGLSCGGLYVRYTPRLIGPGQHSLLGAPTHGKRGTTACTPPNRPCPGGL